MITKNNYWQVTLRHCDFSLLLPSTWKFILLKTDINKINVKHAPRSLSFTFSKEIKSSHIIERRDGSKVIFARFLCPRGDMIAGQVHDPICCCLAHGSIVE